MKLLALVTGLFAAGVLADSEPYQHGGFSYAPVGVSVTGDSRVEGRWARVGGDGQIGLNDGYPLNIVVANGRSIVLDDHHGRLLLHDENGDLKAAPGDFWGWNVDFDSYRTMTLKLNGSPDFSVCLGDNTLHVGESSSCNGERVKVQLRGEFRFHA